MKIFIVDDEVEICNIFYDFFTRKGHEVIKATSAEDALEKLKTEKPNLVFLDIKMPGMDGIEALKQIKKIDKTIPVIMVTVLDDEKTAKRAIKLGAYDYVTKPLSFDYLEKAVLLAELNRRD